MIKRIICIGVVLVMVFAMVACEPKKKGEFYTLEEAYEQNLITQDDLKSIAYYQNSYYQNGEVDDESYEPIPKSPEILSRKTENAIKETEAYNMRNLSSNPIEEAKADDVTILRYYGTYNNCVAVKIDNGNTAYIQVLRDVTVGDVIIHYNDGNSIIIFKEK